MRMIYLTQRLETSAASRTARKRAASTRKRWPSRYSRLDKISFAWVPGLTWEKVCAIRPCSSIKYEIRLAKPESPAP